MPITIDALTESLSNGIRSFDTNALEFSNVSGGEFSPVFDKLLVQIFGSAVTTAQNLHSGSAETAAVFSVPATTGDAAPNFKVKSYLNAPVVCAVGTSGTVSKIAFALVHTEGSYTNITPAANETIFAGGVGNAATTLPAVWASEEANHGDVFMVITVSPGIAVTAGGYLTVKGWASGVAGSDSFTYVTLQSGS